MRSWFRTKNVQVDNGRCIFIQAVINEIKFQIANIYAPTVEKDITIFFRMLRNKLTDFISNDYYSIFGGDLNCPLSDLDKKWGSSDLKTSGINETQPSTSTFYLQDVWRIRNPDKRRFTWRQHKPLIQCRLDLWLTSDVPQDHINRTDIISSVKSDHSVIVLEIDFSAEESQGNGLGKFNNSL